MVPCFWQVQRPPLPPPPKTFAGQLEDPTAALCRAWLPPMAPPVAAWSKEEKLAGVFSGQPQTKEGATGWAPLLSFKLVNADSCAT